MKRMLFNRAEKLSRKEKEKTERKSNRLKRKGEINEMLLNMSTDEREAWRKEAFRKKNEKLKEVQKKEKEMKEKFAKAKQNIVIDLDFDDIMTFGDLFASWNLNNRGRYDNPEYDAAVRVAMNSTDPRTRMDAMAKSCSTTKAVLPLWFTTQRLMTLATATRCCTSSPIRASAASARRTNCSVRSF